MDTDDLSTETYKGVIAEAEKFTHDLSVHFGVLAADCENEEEYLSKALKLVEEIKELDDFDLEMMFFGTLPDKQKLETTLQKIASNIKKVKKIPEENRTYDF